jgi:hypothetical protein
VRALGLALVLAVALQALFLGLLFGLGAVERRIQATRRPPRVSGGEAARREPAAPVRLPALPSSRDHVA